MPDGGEVEIPSKHAILAAGWDAAGRLPRGRILYGVKSASAVSRVMKPAKRSPEIQESLWEEKLYMVGHSQPLI